MKKLFLLLIFMLVGLQSFAQLPPAKFDDGIRTTFIHYYGQTTAQRDAFSFGLNDRVLLNNITVDEWQWWDGDSWELFGDGKLTNEEVEDIVGAMVSGNTETLITVTYDDGGGKLNFVVDNDLANYSNVTSNFSTGAHVTISDAVYSAAWNGDTTTGASRNAIYDKIESIAGGTESTTVSDTPSLDLTMTGTNISGVIIETDGSVTNEIQVFDQAQLNGNNLELSLSSDGELTKIIDLSSIDSNLSTEEVQDLVGAMISANTETRITVTYNDTTGKLDFVVDDDLSNYDNTNSNFVVQTDAQFSGTGTAISLDDNVRGKLYNVAIPSAATAFTTNNLKTGGFAQVFINSPSQPTVNGSTVVTGGNLFEANTDMILVIYTLNGSTVKHYYINQGVPIAGGGSADDTPYGISWNGNTDAATKNTIYDKIETISGSTNLSNSFNGTTVTIESDTGTNTIINEATGGSAGVLSAARLLEIIANNAKVTDDDDGVPEVFGVGWDGDGDSPTKNDIYDAGFSQGLHTVDTDNQTLDEVLTQGQTSSQYIGLLNSADYYAYSGLSGTYPRAQMSGTQIIMRDVSVWTRMNTTSLEVYNGAASAHIKNPNGTFSYDFLFPDFAGTFAMEADASGFNGNLSTTDNTLQEIAQKFDDLVVGGGTDDQIASEVPNTPSGNLLSTDVQAALNELQTELDGASTGAHTPVTNLSNAVSATQVLVQSSTGSDTFLNSADGTSAGILTSADWLAIQANISKVTDDDTGVAEVYGVGWDADTDSPQKNDIWDANFSTGAHTTNTDSQTLTFTNPNLSISGGNSVDISTIDTNTQLSNEQVEDIAGGMVTTTNTETLIAVTYQDLTGDIDFVVEDDLSLYNNTISNFSTGAHFSPSTLLADYGFTDDTGGDAYLANTQTFTGTNTFQKTDIDTASPDLVISQTSTGDAFQTITAGSNSFSFGIDNSTANDDFVFSHGTSLTSNPFLEVIDNGEGMKWHTPQVFWEYSTSSIYSGVYSTQSGTGDNKFTQYAGATGFTFGVDNSEDVWNLSLGGELQTDDLLEVDTSGNLDIKSDATVLGGDFIDVDGTTSLTGTAINLSDNITGKLYNVASPSGSATFTTNNLKTGGFAQVYINRSSQPSVNGSTTTTGGNLFQANSDMILVMYSPDGTNVKHYYISQGEASAVTGTKSITVESPSSSEDITMFYVSKDMLIKELRTVLNGSSTPSVSYTVRYSTNRTLTGTEIVTGGSTTTSTTTGDTEDWTNGNMIKTAVPAGSWIWLETTAQLGTVDMWNLTIIYEE